MTISRRQWIIAILAAVYLYFLLPATAVMFYELHHLTGIDAIYWGYSGFKAAGYYLGVYEHRLLVCLLVAAAILIIPALFKLILRR
tara:strand:- start:31 stop:288 length:258 start_codon:yes stop_codon:yes gene_type:complete